MITRSLKFALFLLPFVQQQGAVFASESQINILTNNEEKTYKSEDLKLYNFEQVNEAFGKEIKEDLKAKIDEECYKFPGGFEFDINNTKWIDTLTDLHYSNVRTRNAAKNRINKDNIGKWTYASKDEYPAIKNLNVEGSMEAMKELIKQALNNSNVQYTVTHAAEFLGAAFFELVKSLKPRYTEHLKTGNLKCFLDYDKYYLNEIFNNTLEKTNFKPGSELQQLYRDFIYYVQDFDMLTILNNVLYIKLHTEQLSQYYIIPANRVLLRQFKSTAGSELVSVIIKKSKASDLQSSEEPEISGYDSMTFHGFRQLWPDKEITVVRAKNNTKSFSSSKQVIALNRHYE